MVSTYSFNLILGESVIPKVIGMMICSDNTFKNEELFSIDSPCGDGILLKSILYYWLPNFVGEEGMVTLK